MRCKHCGASPLKWSNASTWICRNSSLCLGGTGVARHAPDFTDHDGLIEWLDHP